MRRKRRSAARQRPQRKRLKRRALNAAGALIAFSLLIILTAPKTGGARPAPTAAPTATPTAPAVVAAIAPTEAQPIIAPLITPSPAPLPRGDEPLILIYHTHTTEAYAPTERYDYEPSGESRTRDNDMNIVAVGELLAKTLNEKYGIPTLHDITDHEPPALKSAYSRSLKTMLAYRERYPSLIMYIDVHRDSGKGPDYVTVNGVNRAKLMFVVGTGKGATGSGYDDMPDFESNLAAAERITEYLRSINDDLMRDIRVKTGRYNQHVSDCCLLVEVGHNGNTLEEALASAELLAEAIAANFETGSGLSLVP